ncbi:UDP-N-acetylglucosamine 2-epimerase (non-hydrolyzing) [candidate division WOR-3 bacterium]|nr:UDP-N-acetylglucosamine 2-epimerase (non-hydrolyzing) [candidate division WOR-3 bacterium]HHD82974.1 UDP-N-acetylglucosamine 2-epimerase (non-hydrolyzing) [Bacteroidota bacterium]
MNKVIHVVGARPQFIKMAPLYNALRENLKQVIIHTGQHYDFDMSDIFFDQLNIPEPDYNLEVGSGKHGEQTAKIITRLEEKLLKEQPSLVILYGDTNSTLGAAIACSKLHFPMVHVEAGVRSFNRKMPEEINRIVTDKVADIHFAPTKTAVNNLEKEGINRFVYNTGDIMYDILKMNLTKIEHKKSLIRQYNLSEGEYILVTVHREVNTDRERLENVISALSQIEEPVVFPLHPRTKKRLVQYNLLHKLIGKRNMQIISPVGYIEMLILEKFARLIITDSGGIQKEAYIIGIPCITLREETEWVETVDDGWNILVGNDETKILEGIKEFHPRGRRKNIFGDGNSAINMKKIILAYLNGETNYKLDINH